MIVRWIQSIASKLGVSLQNSEHLKILLVRRANYLKRKVKRFTGSAKKMQFLQQTWELKVNEKDVVTLTEMRTTIENLEEELMELHQEASHITQDVKELAAERNHLKEREEQLTLTVSKVSEDNRRLRSLTRELTATVNRGGCTPNTRRGRYKSDSECTEKHRS